ncbi:MAG: triose-phosphate isomerase [Ktedonobacteraceae bacterium]
MAVQRSAIIAGNWKMNYGPQRAASFAMEILPALDQVVRSYPYITTILCPPAISLMAVQEVMASFFTPRVELGAQNMYYEERGAFTGEIAPDMIRELCTTVILGHSERREYFGETDEQINKKTLASFKHRLRPIVCVGENQEQYASGKTESVIYRQVHESLANLPEQYVKRLVIAYEPLWAIGAGQAATPEGANRVIHFIRQTYTDMYGPQAGAAVRILYGGSVTSVNIGDFVAHPDIDGALVGGASLKLEFVEIVRRAITTMQH